MKKLFLLLTLVFVVFTLLVLSQQTEDAPSADETETQGVLNNLAELLEVIFFPRQVNEGIRASSSPLQFDASECSRTPLITESVRVKFSGYELEFPCTANANGNVYIRQEEGQEDQARYTLYLTLQLWDGNGTIWSDQIIDDYFESSQHFRIILRSDGKPKSSPVLDDLDDFIFIMSDESAGLDIYRSDSGTGLAIGVLKNFRDVSGQYPTVSCSLHRPYEVEDIFSESHRENYIPGTCSASWNLTEDIRLVIFRLDAHYAYDIAKLYQIIQPEIQQIVKQQHQDRQTADAIQIAPPENGARLPADTSTYDHQVRADKNSRATSPMSFDTGACSRTPLITESITTQFAGYELAFPCTSGSTGLIRTEQQESGQEQTHYRLSLRLQLWDGNGTIWDDQIPSDLDSAESFSLTLQNNGQPQSSPILDDLHNYTLIRSDEKAGLDIYFRNFGPRLAVGVLTNVADASGNHPSITCPLVGPYYEIDDLFSESREKVFVGSRSCTARWNLTQDIALSVSSFRPYLAHDFAQIYQTIDSEIQEIIKGRP